MRWKIRLILQLYNIDKYDAWYNVVLCNFFLNFNRFLLCVVGYLRIHVYILIVRNSNGIQAEANECVSINVWIWFACYFFENSFVPPLDILRGLPLNLCLATICTEFLLYTVNRVTCLLFLNLVYGHFVLVTGYFESGIGSDRSCLFFLKFDFNPNGT